jgi:hypothetical protein
MLLSYEIPLGETACKYGMVPSAIGTLFMHTHKRNKCNSPKFSYVFEHNVWQSSNLGPVYTLPDPLVTTSSFAVTEQWLVANAY